MSITYTIAIDTNNDGDFSDSGEPISSNVLRLRWRLGMAQPFDSMAQPTWAEITLRNNGGAFSPERSGMVPGQRIRIQSDDGTTVRTHFTGFISRIDPSTGDQGERTAVITAVGAEERLSVNVVRLKPLENVRADEAIGAVLDQCQLRHTVLDGMFILDEQSTLGTHKLAGDAIPRQFETGVSTFAYLGETWAQINAETAIRQLTESERGRFYIDREGDAVFLNRHHTLVNTSVDATFADDMDGLNYTYGADIRNRVQLQVTPRSIGQPDTILWQLDNAQRIAGGKTQRIAISYHDESGNPVNGRNINFSYVASTSDSGGSDAGGSAGVENGGFEHTVTWLLEPADNAQFAIVGLMTLDGGQGLAY